MNQSTGMRYQKKILANVDATAKLGHQLATTWLQEKEQANSKNNPLTMILLKGELGAGKTSLVKGLAKGLGISEDITSPSFALSHHYKGYIKDKSTALIHLDLYRLENISSANEIFAQEEEYSEELGALLAVEWPERSTLIPNKYWEIKLVFKKINYPEYGRIAYINHVI